ncbi:hypothetical protein TSUD_259600 [Trifolium subterraneum]|uniref:Uncharacterized protein n=1 Tax=Trifolium subterraneum TaxID=3900 RepID=A0A2Z6NN84_TRISU|nr:hypothetical protein TSUD_259600 [Trifolium subterraneum]
MIICHNVDDDSQNNYNSDWNYSSDDEVDGDEEIGGGIIGGEEEIGGGIIGEKTADGVIADDHVRVSVVGVIVDDHVGLVTVTDDAAGVVADDHVGVADYLNFDIHIFNVIYDRADDDGVGVPTIRRKRANINVEDATNLKKKARKD